MKKRGNKGGSVVVIILAFSSITSVLRGWLSAGYLVVMFVVALETSSGSDTDRSESGPGVLTVTVGICDSVTLHVYVTVSRFDERVQRRFPRHRR